MDSRQTLENNEEFKKALTDEDLYFSKDKNGDWWFHERIHDGWGQSIRVDGFKLHQFTGLQKLAVFYNKKLGHVMVLDGAVQIAEENWREYQENLAASVILPQYDDPTQSIEVLIIGGGDVGVATVTRQLFPQANITMIEIDAGVVAAAKSYLPTISESLRVPHNKFNLIIGDGIKFVADTANHNKYAAIIVDCTDPCDGGPAVGLFGTSFQGNLKKCLIKNGIVIQQSGTLDMQLDEVKQTVEMMKGFYKYPFVLPVNMLTYPGTMALVGGSDLNIRDIDRDMFQKRFADTHKLDGKTSSFKPDIFLASLNNLPPIHQSWLNNMLSPPHTIDLKSFAGTPHAFTSRMSTAMTPTNDHLQIEARKRKGPQ